MAVMSPHGDLIASAAGLLVPVAVALAVYAWVRWLAFREQRRHNRAVERALARLPRCKFNEGGRS